MSIDTDNVDNRRTDGWTDGRMVEMYTKCNDNNMKVMCCYNIFVNTFIANFFIVML